MLAQSFRRVAPKLPLSSISVKSTRPIVCKRWKSSTRNVKSKEKKDVNEMVLTAEERQLKEESHPMTKDGERWTYSNEDKRTWDYIRMKAGKINLVPHHSERHASVFVITGEQQTLDGYMGEMSENQESRRYTVPTLWLRDNCQCDLCRNPKTRQRNFNTFALGQPRLIKSHWDIRGYRKDTPWINGIMPENYLPDDVKSEVLMVKFDDGHVGEYSKRFISQMLVSKRITSWGVARTWDAETYDNTPDVWGDTPLTFEQAMSGKYKATMLRIVDTLDKWGVMTVEDVPAEDGEATKQLLEEIGPIRETHYGGFYDFTADLSKNDTAYTNEALDPHTDTTYFTEPAGLQAFHVLSHTSSKDAEGRKKVNATGGKTILVDGFRAAVLLEKADPEAFHTLTRVRIPWLSNGNRDACVTPDARYPVIELHPESGEMTRIRWNMADRGSVPVEDAARWYQAARKFHAMVSHPAMQLQIKLQPGTVLLTNNWRVLHGRTAFTGDRRVCGGYINRDDFHSRWRLCKGTNDFLLGQTFFQDHLPSTSKAAMRAIRANREKYGAYGYQQ